VGDHADLRARVVVARADRAHLLLRRNGGVGRGVDTGKPAGGMGADRAAFARDVEGAESRGAGQGLAARVRGVVQASRLGACDLGAARDVGVAGGVGVVGLRAEYRVARAAVPVEARRGMRRGRGGWPFLSPGKPESKRNSIPRRDAKTLR